MKRFALLIAAGLAAALVTRRRRQRVAMSPAPAPPPESPVDAAASARAQTVAHDPGVASDADTREQESRHTAETRYERMIEQEAEERRRVAERLRDDPIVSEP
jgi:hypothetical protein